MPQNRFFIDDPLTLGSFVTLDPKEAHHLRVMRKKGGEKIELINGKGVLAQGRIGESVEIVEREQSAPPPQIILCQALPKLNRLDTIVEKGCEIGMSALYLFPGERSEKKSLTLNQKTRITHLLIAALKQCGRLYLPEVRFLPPLQQWPPLPGLTLYGELDTDTPLPRKLPLPLHFVVGPEGGFSPAEKGHLEQIAQGVRLNPAILRTDTAPLVALSLINYILN